MDLSRPLNTNLTDSLKVVSLSYTVTLQAGDRTDFGVTLNTTSGYMYVAIATIDYLGSSYHIASSKWNVYSGILHVSVLNQDNNTPSVQFNFNVLYAKPEILYTT